ncbi:unnamed protein product [Brassica rapa]|uniref:Uncharacterized protein n=1 Tax=Brassica campestris TaxID=3711 RepID=A0A8D9HRM9_BRACM|nr:unnamed protein product [Brassica rapa]
MMADAQKKNCPHKIPITGSYCIPTKCLDMCKKQHGTTGSCSEEKGFCNCASKKRRSTNILHLLVPKSLFEKKQSMPYNEDVNVKGCACSDPSCNKWSDLYPHAQVTRRNLWAKKLK